MYYSDYADYNDFREEYCEYINDYSDTNTDSGETLNDIIRTMDYGWR